MKVIKIEIIEETKTASELQSNESIIRYAWGNENHKTWFITKTKKAFLPKGSRRLYTLICNKTLEPLYSNETYPKVDDVISDVGGLKLKIIDIK